ncbi:CD209 antigen-like protein A [Pseudochaenichthys georgianus]|uniref:CD209 antigen-like protein A n=1 Tax=Pseudochaenichthys georgianus TaxID=52239 RepID=UPI00146DB0C3|nr:CD209 antigen-like protein A [Pseudochaenichthys georgianus]
MEEIYANADDVKTLSTRSSTIQEGLRRFLRASVLGLGLLSVFLLAGLIGLAVHHHNCVQASDQLINQLNASLTEKTREVECLKKACPERWRKLNCSCYVLSTEKASWQQSRDNCRSGGADLVILDSNEELMFLDSMIRESQTNYNMINGDTWIGLSDTEKEGTWKWVDTTPLNLTHLDILWNEGQPDNGGGSFEEDCAYINPATWLDDRSCWENLLWICEK